jgi:hypothetical protein
VSSPWTLSILFRISGLHDPCGTIPLSSRIPGVRKPGGLPDLCHVSSYEGMVQIIFGTSSLTKSKDSPLCFPVFESPKWRSHDTCPPSRWTDQISLVFWDFHYGVSRPFIIRTSEIPSKSISTPISGLFSSAHKGLNLVLLLTDPTAIGCLSEI